MATQHLIVKPEKIASLAVGMLQQSITLPNTFQKEGLEKFAGSKDDAYSIKVPGVLPYRRYEWRNDRSAPIKYDRYAEKTVTVEFGDMVYSGVKVIDEQFKMDLNGWGDRILPAQIAAVGRGVQREAVDFLVNAPYAVTVGAAEENLRAALIEARRVLNTFNVPDGQRWLVVGSDFEAALLSDEKLTLAQNVGDNNADSALRNASLGRLFGFNIVADNTIPADAAFAYVGSAFVFVNGAPLVPLGAAYGASASYEGIALRWTVDYDQDYQEDRSVIATYPGFRTVKDFLVYQDGDPEDNTVAGSEKVTEDEHFVRGIKLELNGTSVYPEEGDELAIATGLTAPASGDDPSGD